jgi:hypothetical protein
MGYKKITEKIFLSVSALDLFLHFICGVYLDNPHTFHSFLMHVGIIIFIAIIMLIWNIIEG